MKGTRVQVFLQNTQYDSGVLLEVRTRTLKRVGGNHAKFFLRTCGQSALQHSLIESCSFTPVVSGNRASHRATLGLGAQRTG